MSLPAILNPKGRIGRGQWWLRLVAIVLLWGVLAIGWLSLFGRAETGFGLSFAVGMTLSLVFFAIVVIAGIARLHDRGKSGWWLVLFYGVPSWLNGVSGSTWQGAPATTFEIALAIVGTAISLWGLIELGFLRGTRGPNRFGPQP